MTKPTDADIVVIFPYHPINNYGVPKFRKIRYLQEQLDTNAQAIYILCGYIGNDTPVYETMTYMKFNPFPWKITNGGKDTGYVVTYPSGATDI